MKSLTKTLALASICAASVSPAVGLSIAGLDHIQDIYFGVNTDMKAVKFESGYGDKMFSNNYVQTSPYIGLKFNDYVGIEIGFKNAYSKAKMSSLEKNDSQLGVIIPEDAQNFVIDNNRYKAKGLYINVVGYYPITEDSTNLFASFGLARIKTSLVSEPIVLEQGGQNQVNNGANEASVRYFSKTKIVPQLTVGLEHMLLKNIGVKAYGGYEWNKMTMRTEADNVAFSIGSSEYIAKQKNNFVIGVGAFVKF